MYAKDSPAWQQVGLQHNKVRMATLLVVSGLLAFVIWTIPNWHLFWANYHAFPMLWLVPTNRRAIVALVVKMVSPLLIMGIVSLMFWIFRLIQLVQQDHTTTPVMHTQGIQEETEASLHTGTSLHMPDERWDGIVPFPSIAPLTSASSWHRDVAMRSESDIPRTDGARQPQEPPLAKQTLLLEGEPRVSSPANHVLSPSVGSASEEASLPVAMRHDAITSTEPRIVIRLLKDVTVAISVPGSGNVVVPMSLNAKRVQLLAYIAWRRGELIDREKIMEHIFGWGLSDEDATEDKLAEKFESHKKLLRKKIKEVAEEQINKPAGRQVIDTEHLDIFCNDAGFWGLSDRCQVPDLEEIEGSYKVIALARKEGKLVDEIPAYILASCERLIANYPGDFLETMIKKYPGEFRAFQGRSSWVRRPVTLFRDYYLDALWYTAAYESRRGQQCAELMEAIRQRGIDDAEIRGMLERLLSTSKGGTLNGKGTQVVQARIVEELQRAMLISYGKAAQRYQTYAMYACNNKFDLKVSFSVHGEYGERIGMSERAVRRCVVLLGAMGRTDMIDQVWSSYYAQMKSISDHRWEPTSETKADVAAAKAQTSAYRFAEQIAQMSGDLVEQRDRAS